MVYFDNFQCLTYFKCKTQKCYFHATRKTCLYGTCEKSTGHFSIEAVITSVSAAFKIVTPGWRSGPLGVRIRYSYNQTLSSIAADTHVVNILFQKAKTTLA